MLGPARRAAVSPYAHLLQWHMNPPVNGSDRTKQTGLILPQLGCYSFTVQLVVGWVDLSNVSEFLAQGNNVMTKWRAGPGFEPIMYRLRPVGYRFHFDTTGNRVTLTLTLEITRLDPACKWQRQNQANWINFTAARLLLIYRPIGSRLSWPEQCEWIPCPRSQCLHARSRAPCGCQPIRTPVTVTYEPACKWQRQNQANWINFTY